MLFMIQSIYYATEEIQQRIQTKGFIMQEYGKNLVLLNLRSVLLGLKQ